MLTEPNRQKSRRKKGFGLRNRSPKSQIASDFPSHFKSQCSIALSCLGNRCDFWGLRWASQSQIAKIAAISVRYENQQRNGLHSSNDYPEPPTLAFLKKARENSEKSKGFSLCGTPKILGKRKEKRIKKQGKSENEKKQGNRKKQGLEGQGNEFPHSTARKTVTVTRISVASMGKKQNM